MPAPPPTGDHAPGDHAPGAAPVPTSGPRRADRRRRVAAVVVGGLVVGALATEVAVRDAAPPPGRVLPPGVTATAPRIGTAPGRPEGSGAGGGPEPSGDATAAGGTASASPAAGGGRVAAAAGPITPQVHSVALDALRGAALAARSTPRFSLVGVTWPDPARSLGTPLRIRTHSATTGDWHTWELAGSDDGPGAASEGSAVRGGTDPVWVGDSDGVEVLVNPADLAARPDGLRLDLVDPGHAVTTRLASDLLAPVAFTVAGASATAVAPSSSAVPTTTVPTTTAPTATVPTATAPTATAPTATAPTAPAASAMGDEPAAGPLPTTSSAPPSQTPSQTLSQTAPGTSLRQPSTTSVEGPPMVTRAEWGADERLRRAGPAYASGVSVVFVHHTASSNSYDCAASAAVVRSLYAYHTRGRGWNDIGYNFLVDRCGTLFEGRYGGADRPVIGAQTYGFNTGSAGVAVIGSYSGTRPPEAVLQTLARIAAWKLALGAVAPNGSSTLVEGASDSRGFSGGRSYSFAAVSGHRDGYSTECPGRSLYARLPTVRALAAQYARAGGLVVTGISGGSTVSGTVYTRGDLALRWRSTVPASMIGGYQVVVDGRVVASVPASARSAAVELADGRHTVAVRADYLHAAVPGADPAPGDPAAAAPRALSASAVVSVVTDLTDPSFTSGPVLSLRAGTVNRTGTPVRVTWRAADDKRLARVVASTPTRATFGAATTAWNTAAGPGPRTFTLTAQDGAGNSRTARVAGTASLAPETAGTRSRGWYVNRNRGYVDGVALASPRPGSSLTWTVTGRSVAWVATRTRYSGQAVVYLDGVKAAVVDTRSTGTAFRQAVWVRNGLSPGRHTVRVVVVGTRGRPTVMTDGVVALT